MAYKTIMTVWDDRTQSRAAVDMAIRMVAAEEGHLNILCLGVDRIQPGLYYAGATPSVMDDGLQTARADAQRFEQQARARLDAAGINWSCRAMVAQISGISYAVSGVARFSDLVVLPSPYADEGGEEASLVLESVLFDGHAPALICPPEIGDVPGKRIVVAWNQSAEALRTVRAAMPLLKAAESVDIAIVDPGRHDEDESDPGVQLSTMLARHGVNVSVSVLARTMPKVVEVLDRHMTDSGADLLVMGAYGHSRFRESILGGATRDMLQSTAFPVFMAH